MDFTLLKKKLGLGSIRQKKEAGPLNTAVPTIPSSSTTRTLCKKISRNLRSLTVSTSSSSKTSRPSRPIFGRAVSDTHITKSSTDETPSYPPLRAPGVAPPPANDRRAPTRPPAPRSPVVAAIQRTFGPSQLRSVLPQKPKRVVRPKTARHSIDETPAFASGRSSFSSPAPALPGFMTASTSAPTLSTIPASPVDSKKDDSPRTNVDHAPLMLQRPASSPLLDGLPSPCASDFGGDLCTPSPTLECFTLGYRAGKQISPNSPSRLSTSSSNAVPPPTPSPTTTSRLNPDSPVLRSTRITVLKSSKSFLRLADKRPMALDLSAATRKPRVRQPTNLMFVKTPDSAVGGQLRQTPPVSPKSDTRTGEAIGVMNYGDKQKQAVLDWVLDTPPKTPEENDVCLPVEESQLGSCSVVL